MKGRECWDSEPTEQLKGTETKAITGYVSSCPSTTLRQSGKGDKRKGRKVRY